MNFTKPADTNDRNPNFFHVSLPFLIGYPAPGPDPVLRIKTPEVSPVDWP
jgi:hypothetical protein